MPLPQGLCGLIPVTLRGECRSFCPEAVVVGQVEKLARGTDNGPVYNLGVDTGRCKS